MVQGQPEQKVLETPSQPVAGHGGGLWFKASLSKKFLRPHLNQWLDMVACACHVICVGRINKKITVHAGLGQKQDPISKITNVKRAGGVAQVVECLHMFLFGQCLAFYFLNSQYWQEKTTISKKKT
jgi:hypothetical protein